MKKVLKIIILWFTFVYFVIRISLIRDALFNISHMGLGFTSNYFNFLDIIFGTIILYCLYRSLLPFITKHYLRVVFKILLVIFGVLIFGAGEGFLLPNYYFSSSIEACNYSQLCEIKSLLRFEENDISVFINDSKYIEYYKKSENGWRVNNKYYKYIHRFELDDIIVEIYSIEDKYFVYAILNDSIAIEDLVDNTDREFSPIKIADYDYYVKNRYGKFIDSIADYKIVISDKEFYMKDF